MQYLNIIYFLIITYYGYKFLLSNGREVRGTLDSDNYYWFTGPELFWCLTFSTGLVALSANVGLDLMAIRLGVLEFFCLVGLFVVKGKVVWSTPLQIYCFYILWIVIGCFFSPVPGYGFRVVLKYLYPILICLFAAKVVRDNEVFIKSSFLARYVGIFAIVYYFLPGLSLIFPGLIWYSTAGCINFITLTIFSLGLYQITKERMNLIFSIVFLVPCFVFVFRTSIMGNTLAIMTFFFFKYKLKSLPAILGILLLSITLAFSIPSVRNKMFFDSNGKNTDMLYEGKISMDDINSNGRFAIWEWSLEHFWEPHMLEGAGTGNLQETFYAQRHPFIVKICHNDYVQLLCDNGLIGIILFGGSFFLIIGHCFVICNTRRYSASIHLAAITAGASLAGVMLTMYTDNVVNYTMCTFSMPLGFYGMALGMKRKFDNGIKDGI